MKDLIEDTMDERRTFLRKDILKSFNIYMQVPEFGTEKIYMKDVCMGGLGFYISKSYNLKIGEFLDCYININNSLRLPVSLKIVYLKDELHQQNIGCEFNSISTKEYDVFSKFVNFIYSLYSFMELKKDDTEDKDEPFCS